MKNFKLIKGERGIMNTLQWLVIKVNELLARKSGGSSSGEEDSDLTLEQARQNGNVLEGDVEFKLDEDGSSPSLLFSNYEEDYYNAIYLVDS